MFFPLAFFIYMGIMMYMAEGLKRYEIGYLLPSSLQDGEALTYSGTISALIEELHGIMEHSENPKNRKFSYQVKKERSGFFGWVTFRMEPARIMELEKKIKEQHLFRYILLEAPEGEKRTPHLRTIRRREESTVVRPIPREEEKMDEKLDLEALDKKLEEILGK